jgi:hypothetical protein
LVVLVVQVSHLQSQVLWLLMLVEVAVVAMPLLV